MMIFRFKGRYGEEFVTSVNTKKEYDIIKALMEVVEDNNYIEVTEIEGGFIHIDDFICELMNRCKYFRCEVESIFKSHGFDELPDSVLGCLKDE